MRAYYSRKTIIDLLICADKQDWVRVDVNAGETLAVFAYPELPSGSRLELLVVRDEAAMAIVGSPFGFDDDPYLVAWKRPPIRPDHCTGD